MSWDTVNCSEGWAKDRLFPRPDAASLTTCDVNIVFFSVYVAVLALMQLATATSKLSFIIRRAREEHYRVVSSQVLTLGLAFTSFLTLMLMIIFPNAGVGPGTNVMFFLYGILVGVSQWSMVRWVWKLRRVGYRLILKRLPGLKALVSSQDTRKREKVTVALTASAYVTGVLFVFACCVLGMIFPTSFTLVRVAFGIFAVFIFQMASSGMYQLQECSDIMAKSIRNARELGVDSEMVQKYQGVLDKFRRQHHAMAILGSVAFLLCVLIAAGVMPAAQEMYLLFVSLDVAANVSMTATILCSPGGAQQKLPTSDEQRAIALRTSKLGELGEGNSSGMAPGSPTASVIVMDKNNDVVVRVSPEETDA